MSLSEATKEAIYLKNLLNELINFDKKIILYNDNQGAQKLSKNMVLHGRTKHIDVRHHFVRDAVLDGLIEIKYLPTDKMTADILTKNLNKSKHNLFTQNMGLGNFGK